MTARTIDIVRDSPVSDSARARQLEAMFDVPMADRSRVSWEGSIDFDAQPWQIGLIVGPSGAGKSTTLREVFGAPREFDWPGMSVVDDFATDLSMEAIAGVCQAVGFNTVPAWLRPHAVLSTGEQFRVDLARRMIEAGADDVIVVDEFTSVVDRQVAKIGSHAVAKYVRKHDRRFVAATCHYDVIEWLQPDWIFEPATMTITWRSVQPRPRVECVISPVPHAAWRLFAPYHYLTAKLHKAARCFVLFARLADEPDSRPVPAAFTSTLRRPHPRTRNLMGLSRTVTLPDWQGLALAFVLTEHVAAAYAAIGERVHSYPAHPAYIRSRDRSPTWAMTQAPAQWNPNWTIGEDLFHWSQGRRPNAVFAYCGPAMELEPARRLLGPSPTSWLPHDAEPASDLMRANTGRLVTRNSEHGAKRSLTIAQQRKRKRGVR